ncbi:MAG: [LysW]-lysine hydrolase [Blastocatellia bacterium]|nr:[LysW]-lysine hydrolase [Blastocatellia bacterium]
MVRISSLSGQEANLAAFLVETMNRLGFTQAFVDEAGNAVGVQGSGFRVQGSGENTQFSTLSPQQVKEPQSAVLNPQSLVLLGHMDTVPGDIPVRIEDGKLFGRGAVDAKGPLAAFIVAAARLAKRPDLQGNVVVVGCVEEEAPSSKGAHFAATAYRGDFCVVGEPSGWNAVTLGYKGFIRAVLRCEQETHHTAHPIPTASERACRVWARIEAAAKRFNAEQSRVFDQLLPTLVSINSGGDGCLEWAEIRINLRLPPEMPPPQAEVWLREYAEDFQLSLIGGLPAWSGARTSPLHRAFARGIRAQGGEARYLLKTGTADLNIVAPAWGCPALAYGPGDAALDHTPNEHIVLEEYVQGIQVLEEAIGFLLRSPA